MLFRKLELKSHLRVRNISERFFQVQNNSDSTSILMAKKDFREEVLDSLLNSLHFSFESLIKREIDMFCKLDLLDCIVFEKENLLFKYSFLVACLNDPKEILQMSPLNCSMTFSGGKFNYYLEKYGCELEVEKAQNLRFLEVWEEINTRNEVEKERSRNNLIESHLLFHKDHMRIHLKSEGKNVVQSYPVKTPEEESELIKNFKRRSYGIMVKTDSTLKKMQSILALLCFSYSVDAKTTGLHASVGGMYAISFTVFETESERFFHFNKGSLDFEFVNTEKPNIKDYVSFLKKVWRGSGLPPYLLIFSGDYSVLDQKYTAGNLLNLSVESGIIAGLIQGMSQQTGLKTCLLGNVSNGKLNKILNLEKNYFLLGLCFGE